MKSKTLYFHLLGGAAGDMLLLSLINLGCPLTYLKRNWQKLKIPFKVEREKIKTFHLRQEKIIFKSGKKIDYPQAKKIIKRSSLSNFVKENSLSTYQRLYEAECKAHNRKQTHFHQLSEIDCLLEISGFFIALEYLKVNRVFVSTFCVNFPQPATLNLLKGKKLYLNPSLNYETITPTAAALLSPYPQTEGPFKFEKFAFGWGRQGKTDYLLAYLIKEDKTDWDKDEIIKIEANIDDAPPFIFQNLFSLLYKEGAKEVFLENVLMKKMRPGYVVNILCHEKNLKNISFLLFKHTSTFGLRYTKYCRYKLKSEFVNKNTKLGKVNFRRALPPFYKETPEYEDCLKLAQKYKLPIAEVYRKITG